MAVVEQVINERFAAYLGDCCEILPTLPSESAGYSVYSPPFGGLYHYSSSDRDLSNCVSYSQFLEHYEFVVSEISRITRPGRLTSVHCMDFVSGIDLFDLPGDIVRLHEKHGFIFHDRKTIWKEPLKTAIRTRALGLRHRQLLKDSSICRSALADYVVTFRKKGTNKQPIAHPSGLTEYAGELDPQKRAQLGYLPIPEEILKSGKVWTKDPNENPLSHWIWRRYASSVWDDIRINRVLPYRNARESEEEKHCHPLQLDVISRCLTLWSNPRDVVVTPFAGVGSEIYETVRMGRLGVGMELKASFYRQLLQNMDLVDIPESEQGDLFEDDVLDTEEGGVDDDL